jgi:hypothetical protein
MEISYIIHTLSGTTYRNDITVLSLSTVNGWRINPNVFVGIGLGVEKYSENYPIHYSLPVYLDTKYFILKNKVTPFFYTDLGYTLGWKLGSASDFSPHIPPPSWGSLPAGLPAEGMAGRR